LNSPADIEKLLYKLILQFAIYTRGSDKLLDPHLINISKHLKQGLSYQQLTPELLALSQSLIQISAPNSSNLELVSTPTLQLKKELIEQLSSLLAETNIPLKFKSKYSLFKQKGKSTLNDDSAKKVIDLALSLIIDIKDHAVSEHQDIENFLTEMSNQFSKLAGQTLSVSDSQNKSFENREQLNNVINSQIDKIKTSSTNAQDLISLQENVDSHLHELNLQLIKHQKIEIDRHIETNQQLEKMSHKMHELDIEAETLRNNLKIARDKAQQDSLTGLPNRAAYDERSLIEYSRWYRYKNDLSIVIWDIDLFKVINDNFGHKAGDKTLSLVAQLILDNCRESDFIARFGGEEFVMLLPNTNSELALIIAEKIRLIISRSGFNYNGQSISLTISSGISEFSETDTLEAVFERADQALYQSKEQGRNRCTIINQ